MSAHLAKQRRLKSVALSASFDRQFRADTMNARENVKLEKQHRDIELLKNNVEKSHKAEKNRVKSRMQNLRKTVLCRTPSSEGSGTSSVSTKMCEERVHLPKISSLENDSKLQAKEIDFSKSVPDLHLLCAEDVQNMTHFPTITAAPYSPRGTRRILVRERNDSARARTQSHSAVEDFNSNLKCPLESNGMVIDYEKEQCYEKTVCTRRARLDVDSFQPFNRLSSRRRSLSTGDISLAERVNSFLESIENPRLMESSDSWSASNSEDEKESS
ncbi:uncharacterized protein LOC110044754 [Orbicella faveolata]|uniref:uncharacterized protein LOC110044754 n=1 Tax=Orbicella faveolata TaxID=48498 RepID=UPI0009E22DAC|nr:uncharacterized protein LOC110044754 [Orbicella faveolata]XP_020605989.1 uncharacterized protein LOC110044754 [Orbicella faveolata]XP_020605990.1 uncharacterized protein LOC110044754 [Orbicella faveolata]XP_020605991.1 uncharacterized protein LOC110044754 [Orbicella faveolata]